MANEEHLTILKQGVGVWNRWRTNKDVRPDLIEVDEWQVDLTELSLGRPTSRSSDSSLSGLDLRFANFSLANLSFANLSGSKFSEADLRDADLSFANLAEASFMKADLTGANLDRAMLLNTSLRQATLERTILTWADLSGAD